MVDVGRRDVIGFLGAAVASPLAAHAQGVRTPRVAVLFGLAENDSRIPKYLGAFREGLGALGRTSGQDVVLDHRATADPERMRSHATELISHRPDVVVTYTTPATNAVRQADPQMPIVFVAVSDPIGPGFVASISRPGGQITGFTNFEATMGSKWLELVRDITPSVRRIAMLFNPATANTGASGGVYLPSIEAAARALSIELVISAVSNPDDIDGAFAGLAHGAESGMIVMPNAFNGANRERIVAQAARSRIPTVYPFREFVTAGGLLSYGVDYSDLCRRAALYADRILRGGKPADLPVQQPTKFELVINLKTAREVGLELSPTLQARADEVID